MSKSLVSTIATTPLEVLVKARNLISTPERWTQGAFARRADGTNTDVDDPKATAWCSLGAVSKAGGFYGIQETIISGAVKLLREVLRDRDARLTGIMCFNDADKTTHETVLKVFDEAIALAKAHDR